MAGLLGFADSPLGAMGAGLLSVSGPTRMPTSLNQGFAAGYSNLQALRARQQQEDYRSRALGVQEGRLGLLQSQFDAEQQAATERQGLLAGLPPQAAQAAQYAGLGVPGAMIPGLLGMPQTPDNPVGKLIAARDALPPGHPDRQVYDQAIQKAITQQSGVTVNVGEQGFKVPANYMLANPGDPSQGVVPIPGGGADPVTKDREKASKVRGVIEALVRYRDVLQKTGAELLPGANKSMLSSAYTDALLKIKEADQLGVLSGPDMGLMKAKLTDPTTLGANIADTLGQEGYYEAPLQFLLNSYGAELEALVTGRAGGAPIGSPTPAGPLPPGFAPGAP